MVEFRSWLLSRVKFFILLYKNLVGTTSNCALKNNKVKVDDSDENNNDVAKGTVSTIGSQETESDYKIEIKWKNVIIFLYLHAAAIYSLTLTSKYKTSVIIAWTWGILAGVGTTVGAHRYYTHRTFKANLPLRILLIILQSAASQNDMIEWVRDHRVHHKFTDSNADPHNSKRGFFFSHIGWLMCKKHPDVKKFGARVDMSDVESDPVCQFQRKYYVPLVLSLNFVLPVLIPYCIGESFAVVWHGNILRYLIGLHLVWCVNSVSHFWGYRPFDASITSTDSYLMGLLGIGEGWHNYHHCFPWDYKTSELPTYVFNLSTAFIDFFAWIGWATDLKTVPKEMIESRAWRTGDGSHRDMEKISRNHRSLNHKQEHRDQNHFWGFGDTDMTTEDMKNIKVIHE